jgi:hypothetical protein
MNFHSLLLPRIRKTHTILAFDLELIFFRDNIKGTPIKMENIPPNRNPQINRMASSIHRKFFSQNFFFLLRIKQFWTVRTNFGEA